MIFEIRKIWRTFATQQYFSWKREDPVGLAPWTPLNKPIKKCPCTKMFRPEVVQESYFQKKVDFNLPPIISQLPFSGSKIS